MSQYALISDDTCVNVIEYDGDAPYQPPAGCTLAPVTDGVPWIGWTYVDGAWVPPAPPEPPAE